MARQFAKVKVCTNNKVQFYIFLKTRRVLRSFSEEGMARQLLNNILNKILKLF